MSQYYSRLHIKVSSPKIWSRFEDEDDASFGLAELADTNDTSFVFDDEWSSMEDELTGIVSALSETLGEDGIIIADTTNINVDPYNYCIYYLGDRVHTEEFSIYSDEDKCEMHDEVSIGDIPGWLSYGEFSISKKEKEVLFRCGISSVGGHFEEFSADLQIPERVYLRETSFKKRPDAIEQTFAGEEVYFVHSKDSYDPLRLEVMSDLGSLGYLPSEVSDKITPLLSNKRLNYTARVAEVIPASKRNKHAKSSIVSISIEAEVSDKEVPIKDSVPKIDREALAAEAARKVEEERKRKEEEARKAEEERKRREEEARKAEEERKRKEEEASKAEEERKRREEEARKAEEERKRKEEEARRAEEERKRQEAACKAEEERKRKEEAARIAREKAEAEERARKEAEEARKAEEERKRKEQEAVLKKYQEEHAAWEKECAIIRTRRVDAVEKRLSEEKVRLESEIKNRYDAAVKSANDKKAEQARKKSEAESTLAGLGFFKFNDKKIQKANIEAAEAGISAAETDLKKAEEDYKSEMNAVASKVSAMESGITADVERQNPLPKEPAKPVF